MLMDESFIPSSEFEAASNIVNKILRQPVEEIEITNVLPPLNDITDSNKVFKGKLSVLFVDMRRSTDLTDELNLIFLISFCRCIIGIMLDYMENTELRGQLWT